MKNDNKKLIKEALNQTTLFNKTPTRDRYGLDQDISISVEITPIDDIYCFVLYIGQYKIKMHARSLIDLQHKITIAFLDWQAMSLLTLKLLENE